MFLNFVPCNHKTWNFLGVRFWNAIIFTVVEWLVEKFGSAVLRVLLLVLCGTVFPQIRAVVSAQKCRISLRSFIQIFRCDVMVCFRI